MGAEGALFINVERTFMARPPSVKVRITVRAGDAMVAGILAGQLGELPLAEIARLSTAFSLDVLTSKESVISRAEITKLMDEISVQEFR